MTIQRHQPSSLTSSDSSQQESVKGRKKKRASAVGNETDHRPVVPGELVSDGALLVSIRVDGADIKQFEEIDASSICQWIKETTQQELSYISKEAPGRLSAELLNQWAEAPSGGYVLIKKNLQQEHGFDLIGFATLSRTEANLPEGHIEICHLIINPDFRQQYWGTRFVRYLTEAAFSRGYVSVVARVEPRNQIGLKLFRKPDLSFLKEGNQLLSGTKLDSRFVWFERNPDSFGKLLAKIRESHGYSQIGLAQVLGVEKSVVSMIESDARGPTLELLSALWRLEKDNIVRQRLIRTALGLSKPPLVEDYISLSAETDLQHESVKTLWVLTDTLAENLSSKLLQATAESISRERCQYFYFLPWEHSNQSQSTQFLLLLKHLRQLGVEESSLKKQLVCILAPPTMFQVRIALANPHRPENEIHGTLTAPGPLDANSLSLIRLQSDDIGRIYRILQDIYNRLELSENRRIEGSYGDFVMCFPPVEVMNR